jgi:hypothetical protein
MLIASQGYARNIRQYRGFTRRSGSHWNESPRKNVIGTSSVSQLQRHIPDEHPVLFITHGWKFPCIIIREFIFKTAAIDEIYNKWLEENCVVI